jgi:hypothetical protein
MRKIINIYLALAIIATGFVACDELETNDVFEVDESFIPAPNPNPPVTPTGLLVSNDEFCDRVELSWMPTVRTTAYDVYKNGELIAQDLTDTSYVDMEALNTDTEYTVISKNGNGNSESSVAAIGRMSDTPSAPDNFTASNGEYEEKVDLSWDAANFAKFYIVKRGNTVLGDSVIGTAFSDSEDAPQEDTEYSVSAVSVCGESSPSIAIGKADSLLKYSIVLDENFEGFTMGSLTTAESFSGFKPYFQFQPAPDVNGDIEVMGDNTKYLHFKVKNGKSSIQLKLPEISLIVGKSYTLSFDIKGAQAVNLHMGLDAEGGNGSMGQWADTYFLPTTKNSKNANAMGIKLADISDWKSYSFDFPASGTATDDPYPSTASSGWILGPILEGQENPIVQLQIWSKNGYFALDNIKIELIK